MNKIKLALTIAALGLTTLPSWAEDTKTDAYPLDTCVVSGEKFGGDMGDPYIFNYEGREVRFCCKDCKKDFLKDPQKYLKKIDDAVAAKQQGEKSATHE